MRAIEHIAISTVLLLGLCGPLVAQVDEGELKAAFVFNVASFVAWPETDPGTFESWLLCVHQDASIRSALAGLDGRSVSGRTTMIRILRSASEVEGCHVVVVDFSQQDAGPVDARARPEHDPLWPERWWHRVGLLSIADGGDARVNEAVITLVREGARLRFDVNAKLASDVQLTLSSRLLSLARRVL